VQFNLVIYNMNDGGANVRDFHTSTIVNLEGIMSIISYEVGKVVEITRYMMDRTGVNIPFTGMG
jgi:hypothetical protein